MAETVEMKATLDSPIKRSIHVPLTEGARKIGRKPCASLELLLPPSGTRVPQGRFKDEGRVAEDSTGSAAVHATRIPNFGNHFPTFSSKTVPALVRIREFAFREVGVYGNHRKLNVVWPAAAI